MGKQLTISDITDSDKIQKLVNENKLAQKFTNQYKSFGKGKHIGIKGRILTTGKDWDIAYRIDNVNPVSIIAKDTKTNKYLFVVQPRASLEGKKLVLSFPAGLIEKENSITKLNQKITEKATKLGKKPELVPKKFHKYEKEPALLTGLLELKEETGYFPQSCKMVSDPKNPMPKSAGLTNESDNVIKCSMNPKSQSNQMNEKGEDISFIWLTPTEFLKTVKKMDSDHITVENNAWNYMKGIDDGFKECDKHGLKRMRQKK